MGSANAGSIIEAMSHRLKRLLDRRLTPGANQLSCQPATATVAVRKA